MLSYRYAILGHVSDLPIILTGCFTIAGTLGGVTLGAVIDGRRRRHDEQVRQREARRQDTLAVITAAGHLLDAVRLFRSMTRHRRSALAGIGTGVDFAGRSLPDRPSIDDLRRWQPWQLVAVALVAVGHFFKVGGLSDQMQISAGERYQQMVTPPLQRLTAAVAAVQLDDPGNLGDAAQSLMLAGSDLCDEAQSDKREYERAEKAFQQAQQNFRDAASPKAADSQRFAEPLAGSWPAVTR